MTAIASGHLTIATKREPMATHHFKPDRFFNALGAFEPVLRIAVGDTVITTTADAWGKDARLAQVAARPNPQTGPFYVEGAEPGDTLVLCLDRLTPNRTAGFTSAQIAPNAVEPDYVPQLPWLPKQRRPEAEWHVDAAAGTATLISPETRLGRLVLPLAPMLGCFGVAPAGGQADETGVGADHPRRRPAAIRTGGDRQSHAGFGHPVNETLYGACDLPAGGQRGNGHWRAGSPWADADLPGTATDTR